MVITAANIGDVIRMDHNPRCILIENVTDKFVHYRQETGEQYATSEREIAGSVIRDPKVISEFHRNSKLGATLDNVEFSAFRKMLDNSLSPSQRDEAEAVLGFIKGMQSHLKIRITGRQAEQSSIRHASLDDLIRKADNNRQNFGSRENMRNLGNDHSTER